MASTAKPVPGGGRRPAPAHNRVSALLRGGRPQEEAGKSECSIPSPGSVPRYSMLLTTRTAVALYNEGRGDRGWGTGVGGSWISPPCVGAIAVLSCSQEGRQR